MPKLKTHKGMKKRFKVTATGKIKYKSVNRGHKLSHKTSARKRRLVRLRSTALPHLVVTV